MTLKEQFLIYFFKNLIDDNFDEWYSCDIDDKGNFIQDGLNTSKKLITNRTKVFMEYLDTFSKASGLDLNSDYDENTSIASELLLKVLSEKCS